MAAHPKTDAELPIVTLTVEEVSKHVGGYIAEHLGGFIWNRTRVQSLMDLSRELSRKKHPRNSVHAADVLRAAVVLLHASLEDFLRTLAAIHLPDASESVLDRIPLVGSESGRPEKFWLGRLSRYREMTVKQLISASVSAYLNRETYNDTTEIAELLEALGVPLDEVKETFPALDQMMSRRHRIVHRADRIDVKKRGRRRIESLTLKSVEDWSVTVFQFVTRTVTHLGVGQIHSLGEKKFRRGEFVQPDVQSDLRTAPEIEE
jgi:hypothetical protein